MSLPIGVHIAVWVWVVLQIVLVVVAIRVYRLQRTRPLQLLMWACLAYVFSSLAWYFFYVVRAALQYPILVARHPEVSEWQGYTNRASQIVFMILMLLVFRSLYRGGQSDATPKV
jgi:cytochrome bd-type quinol oxidase subunit 2